MAVARTGGGRGGAGRARRLPCAAGKARWFEEGDGVRSRRAGLRGPGAVSRLAAARREEEDGEGGALLPPRRQQGEEEADSGAPVPAGGRAAGGSWAGLGGLAQAGRGEWSRPGEGGKVGVGWAKGG